MAMRYLLFLALLVCTMVQAVTQQPHRLIASAEVKNAVNEYPDMPPAVKSALLETLKKPATRNSWVCEAGEFVACVAVQTVPPRENANSSRLRQLALPQTEAHASVEMCVYVAMKKALKNVRLDDQDLLNTALQNSKASGSIKGKLHQSRTVDNEVISVAYCPIANITASLLEPANLQQIRDNYLLAGHEKFKELIAKDNLQDAIQIWQHLKERELFSPELIVDVALCYQKVDETEKCVAHCKEFLYNYRDLKIPSYFVQLGNLLADILTEDAEELAISAFDKAEHLMLTPRRTVDLNKQQPPF